MEALDATNGTKLGKFQTGSGIVSIPWFVGAKLISANLQEVKFDTVKFTDAVM